MLGPRAEYVDGDRPEEAFADPPTPERAALWRRAFGIERPLAGGFLIATAEDAMLYNIGGPLEAEVVLPFNGRGWLADPSGALQRALRADDRRLAIRLEKHQYAYLTR